MQLSPSWPRPVTVRTVVPRTIDTPDSRSRSPSPSCAADSCRPLREPPGEQQFGLPPEDRTDTRGSALPIPGRSLPYRAKTAVIAGTRHRRPRRDIKSMEQAVGWKELCLQTLPPDVRLSATLTEFLPIHLILLFAIIGILAVLGLAAYCLRQVVRASGRTAKQPGTIAPAPNPLGVPSTAPPGRSSVKSADTSAEVVPTPPRAIHTPVTKPSASRAAPLPAPTLDEPFGIMALYWPGPATPPATPRTRTPRVRRRAREPSPGSC